MLIEIEMNNEYNQMDISNRVLLLEVLDKQIPFFRYSTLRLHYNKLP
jgi:hypothetical protein